MTLYVHHGPHLSVLADALAEQLADAPADPFEPIVVAVPTAGVRDWLTRRLAQRLGVAANIAMPFPGRFLAAALGTPLDADDPWHVDRLTWAVLSVLESGAVDVPRHQRPRRGSPSRRFATARRVADLFDRYAASRPQVLQQWCRGAIGDGTVGATAGGGGGGDPDDDLLVHPLDPAMHWQFETWRAVRARIGVPSPAERLPELVANLRSGQIEPALPATVALFGAGSLAPAQLDVVTALASVRDVRLSVVAPSPVRWHRVAPLARDRLVLRRRFDESRTDREDGHPLVHSWGRLSVETAALLRGLGDSASVIGPNAADAGVEVAAVEGPATSLLDHLQHDIRLDRSPTVYAGGREPVDGTASIQVHACHGVTRQLEVLRDVLGHLFAADPSLQPRDVMVLCPDVTRFEPFARAVFARGSLPVPLKVGDLSLRSENPVASALAAIMAAVADRCTTVDVLAVAALEPVRRRLGITIDDLTRFGTWAETLGTNWGLDTHHRSGWVDIAVDAGTWESSVQSLLLGAAMPAPADRAAFAGVVPHDDMANDGLVSAGRLAELISRLRRVRDLAARAAPIEGWIDILVETLSLLCATEPTDAWQMSDVLRAIDALREQAAVGGDPVAAALDWSDLRAVVDGFVAADPGRLSLRSGRVTMTGMVPMRNVPAKVVCVLGFDEVSLRPPAIDGDDLLALRPCVGERDRRGEQRHLVLDALMAAEQHFVVMCDGSDITTNRRMRFAVQLAELLEVVDASLGGEPGPVGAGPDSPIVVRHPRRAYDEQLFTPPASAFSFDDAMLRAARARRDASVGDVFTSSRWTNAVPIPPDVTLEQLTEACTRPARTLLRDGLDARLPGEVEAHDVDIPLSVSSLDAAAAGQRLLDRFHTVGPVDDWEEASARVGAEWSAAERLRAGNPPGRLIEHALQTVEAEVAELLGAVATCDIGIGPAEVLSADGRVDVDLTLRHRGRASPASLDGVTVVGALRLRDAVAGVAGATICRLRYRRPKKRVMVGAAIDLAAAVASTGSTDWRALTVTRGSSRSPKPELHVLRVVGDIGAATALLEVAAELRVAALRGAVPLFESTSELLHRSGVLDEDELFGSEYSSGDLVDAESRFVWGTVTLAEILDLRPSPAELAGMLWSAIDRVVAIDKLEAAKPSRTSRR